MRLLVFLLLLPSILVAQPRTGIICAHPKELSTLQDEICSLFEERVGGRTYLRGELWGKEVVVAIARIGKVAAAITATHMIESEGVDQILFVGVAGAIDPTLERGDVIIATELIQHDLDSRPFIPKFAIPLLGVTRIEGDQELISRAQRSATRALNGQGRVVSGLVATGDRFVSEPSFADALQRELPDLLAVEMEGAAVAQVCYEYNIPFVVIRIVSDRCGTKAKKECLAFLAEDAPALSVEILRNLLD